MSKENDVLDYIGAMYVEIDTENIVVAINDRACSVLGYTREEVIGENWFNKFVPSHYSQNGANATTVMNAFYDKPILTKKGEERLISWRKTIIQEKEKSSRYICVGEDISTHQNYLKTLHNIASLLLNGEDEVPYHEFVKLVSVAANANHTYIFLNNIEVNRELTTRKICEWGSGKFIDNSKDRTDLQNLPLTVFNGELVKKLVQGGVINMRTSSFTEEEQIFFTSFEIKAILLIPIIVNDVFFGFIGFDNRVNDREWTYSEIEFLKAAVKNLEQKIHSSLVNKALQNENTRFQATMDAIDVMVLVSDFQTNQIIYSNSFANQQVGDVVGKSIMNALKLTLPIPDTHYSLSNLLDAGTPNEAKEYEVISEIRKRVYSCQVKAIKWVKGDWVRLETITDITEKREVENRILESEAKFKKLSTISVEGVFIHDNGVIMEMNQAVLNMLQYTYEEVIGKNVIPIAIAPESHELVFSKLQEPSPKPYEIIGVRKDGKRIPLEIFARSVVHEGENLRVVTLRDITERKKIEQELIAQKNKAEESNRLKTQFLNNLSHEIRTPLNGIVGFTQFLTDPTISEENLKNFVSIIQNSSHQLVRIIDDIIEISKLETKQVKPLIEEVNLNAILIELFSIFEIQAIEKGVSLRLERGLTDKQSLILTDKTKLLKILNNLVENALKFTHVGDVKIGSELVGKDVLLWVKDSGIGIDSAKQGLIFDRFSQADNGTSKEYGGLGLGLAIAKENVELLGGKIKVDSVLGQGTKFSFSLPYNPVNKEEVGNQIEKEKENTVKRYKVLVAEDEEVNFIFLEFLMLKMDEPIEIVHARNGQEAIDNFKDEGGFDLVFMDLKMPEVDGVDATKVIREVDTEIPIIAITAFSGAEEQALALQAGCNDFITKPIDVDEFKALFTKYLNN